jgi:PAS domain S-box-containing protein
MARFRDWSWLIPNCLLLFLSLFLLVKFIFILFFSTAYEPQFMFECTPCYLLSGVTNTQLLVLALVVMGSDLYLHLQASRRELLLSFIPTALLLSGIGTSIMTNPMGLSYIFHYILFGCLLSVVLIDYNYVLAGKPYPTGLRRKERSRRKVPATYGTPILSKKSDNPSQDIIQVPPASIGEFQAVSDAFLQRMEMLLENLEKKTERLEAIGTAIENGQQHLASQEKMFSDRILYNLETLEKIPPHTAHREHNAVAEYNKVESKGIQHPLIDHQTNDFVVIVKRGRIKELSSAFAELLGYQPRELLENNFFMLVSPRALEDARRFYIDRLKGTSLNSFRTSLLKKDQLELLVSLTVTPTIHNGETAEFIHIVVIQNDAVSAVPMSSN